MIWTEERGTTGRGGQKGRLKERKRRKRVSRGEGERRKEGQGGSVEGEFQKKGMSTNREIKCAQVKESDGNEETGGVM